MALKPSFAPILCLRQGANDAESCSPLSPQPSIRVRIVAIKSMYPPCRQCLPYQACSNQDEICGKASSLGQQHEDGKVA